MVEVTYRCPYCGALTSLERDAYLDDRSVTPDPLDGWEYAATTDDFEDADGVEMVCLGNVPALPEPVPPGAAPVADDPTEPDGCGRVYYLNFVNFEEGRELEPPGTSLEDDPNFEFLR